jgi:DNA topoisomerase-1
MERFWKPFSGLVQDKDQSVSRKDVAQARELGIDPKTGRPLSVRMGRFGPFVQLGASSDADKPQFFSLRAGQRIDTLTVDDALQLMKLPRVLGETRDHQKVSANIGRFGPYLRYGDKYVSIKPPDDPHTIELDRALVLIAEKQAADAARNIKEFPDAGIRVLNGRYGPYVTDGTRNARVAKEQDPARLTLEEAQQLLAAATTGRRPRRARVPRVTS